MKYALIDKDKGKQNGLNPSVHIVTPKGMIVNENELRLVNNDIYEAAKILGGEIKDYNEIKRL